MTMYQRHVILHDAFTLYDAKYVVAGIRNPRDSVIPADQCGPLRRAIVRRQFAPLPFRSSFAYAIILRDSL